MQGFQETFPERGKKQNSFVLQQQIFVLQVCKTMATITRKVSSTFCSV